MIEEAYVSFEIAKLLKEKGFDIPVNYEYHYKITIPQFHKKKHNFNGIEYRNCSSEWYSAPTHQMAMQWLRKMHHIAINIGWGEIFEDQYKWWSIVLNMDNGNILYEVNYHASYEDAVEATLKYCLENLI